MDIRRKKGMNLGVLFRCTLFLLSSLRCEALFAAEALTSQQSEAIRGAASPRGGVESIPVEPQLQISQEPYLNIPPSGSLSSEAAQIPFILTKINIINPTVLSEDDLTCLFQDKIGKKITLGELQTIANKMTEHYQTAGYVLTQVILPEQHILNGVATLHVIGGHIDKIIIKGDICPKIKTLIQEYAEPIQACIPLKMKTLERYSLLINDIPGITARAYLAPSKTKLGAADLVIDSSQALASVYVSINNFGSPYLGPVQYSVSGNVNSTYMPGDTTQAQIVTTADRKLNYAQLQHSELLNYEGFRYTVLGRIVQAKPGSTLAPVHVIGRDQFFYNEFYYPILRSREENLFLSGGLTILNDKVRVLGPVLYYDRIRPIHATLSYSLLDRFQGVTHTDITLSHGLKILNASANTLISRPHGRSNFTKWNGTLSRQQLLPNHFSFTASLQGQFSYNALLSASQFGFGGHGVGRGYDPSEILGDRGMSGTAELRYDKPNPPPTLQLIQYYAFYDAGRVWNLKPSSSQQTSTASSCGVGLRLTVLKKANMSFYIAKPLTQKVHSKNNRQARLYFSISSDL
jgi:hemolysin activation/secretion protein